MARALEILFAPPVYVAIALSRLVDKQERKVLRGADRRRGVDRRQQPR